MRLNPTLGAYYTMGPKMGFVPVHHSRPSLMHSGSFGFIWGVYFNGLRFGRYAV